MELDFQNITGVSKVDLNKWAAITIEKFEFQVSKYNLIYSGDLLRSFQATVHGEADGNLALVTFAFNYYLRMLDMGAGKGAKAVDASTSYLRTGPNGRKRYPVFNKVFYGELFRLGELLTNMYAQKGAAIIVHNFKD